MKLCFFTAILFALPLAGFSQVDSTVATDSLIAADSTGDFYDTEIPFVSEISPEFPGGDEKLMQFVAGETRYPKRVLEEGIRGKVLVSFVVKPSGNISDIKIEKSLCKECDEEVIRIIRSMPPWKPAKANGKKVAVRFMLPVIFDFKH